MVEAGTGPIALNFQPSGALWCSPSRLPNPGLRNARMQSMAKLASHLVTLFSIAAATEPCSLSPPSVSFEKDIGLRPYRYRVTAYSLVCT